MRGSATRRGSPPSPSSLVVALMFQRLLFVPLVEPLRLAFVRAVISAAAPRFWSSSFSSPMFEPCFLGLYAPESTTNGGLEARVAQRRWILRRYFSAAPHNSSLLGLGAGGVPSRCTCLPALVQTSRGALCTLFALRYERTQRGSLLSRTTTYYEVVVLII